MVPVSPTLNDTPSFPGEEPILLHPLAALCNLCWYIHRPASSSLVGGYYSFVPPRGIVVCSKCFGNKQLPTAWGAAQSCCYVVHHCWWFSYRYAKEGPCGDWVICSSSEPPNCWIQRHPLRASILWGQSHRWCTRPQVLVPVLLSRRAMSHNWPRLVLL